MTITLDKPVNQTLKPEVKAAWLEHLRSGKYKQGTGTLNAAGKMCCLGVLSDMAADEGVCERTGYDTSVVRYDGETYYLPQSVRTWAGVTEANLYFEVTLDDRPLFEEFMSSDVDNNKVYLAMLNDGGWTFDQIADVIEERF